MYEFYSPTEEEIEALHNVIEHYINTFNIQENIQFEMSLIYKDNHHVGIVIFDNENTVIYNYENIGWHFYLVNEDEDNLQNIEDEDTPLAAGGTAKDGIKTWWWWIAAAVAAITGKGFYDNRRRKPEKGDNSEDDPDEK